MREPGCVTSSNARGIRTGCVPGEPQEGSMTRPLLILACVLAVDFIGVAK